MFSAELFRERRSQLAKIVLLLCGAYFAVAFAGQAWKAKTLGETLGRERAVLARQEAQNRALEARLRYLRGKGYAAYAERVAREDLQMAKPGDHYVFVVPQEVKATAAQPIALPVQKERPAPPPPPRPVWRQWLEVFFPSS